MPVRRLAAAIVAAFGAVAPALAAGPVLEPGTYVEINPATKHAMPAANQVVIVAGKGGRLAFSVNAMREIDYNSGYAIGTLPAGGATATWTQTAEGANCKLTFTALPGHGLRVVQDRKFGDCGFGYGVLADGTYARRRADGPLGKPVGP